VLRGDLQGFGLVRFHGASGESIVTQPAAEYARGVADLLGRGITRVTKSDEASGERLGNRGNRLDFFTVMLDRPVSHPSPC
jgi:hypothetical protein